MTAPALAKPGVRRIGDVLFHHALAGKWAPPHSLIVFDGCALYAVLVDHTRFLPGSDRLDQQLFHTLLANPPSPAGRRWWIDRRAMQEERFPIKVLVVGVFPPAGEHRFVR
jgi:hypothetical protein